MEPDASYVPVPGPQSYRLSIHEEPCMIHGIIFQSPKAVPSFLVIVTLVVELVTEFTFRQYSVPQLLVAEKL
jgi:hypothetical protein